ncbi:uncharacterized protein [Argopecten irradians]
MAKMVKEYVQKMNSVGSVINQSGTSDVPPGTESSTEHIGITPEAAAQTFTEPSRPGQVGADFHLPHRATEQDAVTTDWGTERDWQFYLDWLSEKIPNEIGLVATYLDISSDKQNSIKCDHNKRHEICFHTLWEWFRSRKSSKDNIGVLHEALRLAGRTDIADSDTCIPKPSLFQNEIRITGQEKNVTERDLLEISKKIGEQYPSLARYYGIKEGQIQASKGDQKDNVQAQANNILQKCLKQKLLETRKQLCDGLHYTDRIDIIEMLNRGWN